MSEKDNLNSTSIIRMSAVIFGALFRDIKIRQYDTNGDVLEKPWLVPIVYSSKQAYEIYSAEAIRKPDTQIGEFGRKLPRMCFDLNGLSYDNGNQLMPWVKTVKNKNGQPSQVLFSPAAYIFNYELNIFCKDMDTSIQILDQIIPYFRPEVSVKLKEQRAIPVINDVKIELQSVSKDDNYLEGLQANRLITWSLGFSMTLNYWIKSPSTGKPINEIVVDINDSMLSDGFSFFNLPDTRKSNPKYEVADE